MALIKHNTQYTYCKDADAYYFYIPDKRKNKPAHKRTVETTAVIDIAEDGTIIGFEIYNPKGGKHP